ncbi:hypothetical protein [Knoellia koreensis]|uniref:Uncharacterized protein n=1 Tax=Knoellia koreensis TaxID=2730921 RepID=A0A849HAT9_9MICO|nr:hypothetical protein [Knoellia sp. DB2414S]NNM44528.1 hypothetical protein [Knoellia sp. DB2414S]
MTPCAYRRCSRPLDASQEAHGARFCRAAHRVAEYREQRADERARFVAESREIHAAIGDAVARHDFEEAAGLLARLDALVEGAARDILR